MKAADTTEKPINELTVANRVIKALESLTPSARERVIHYVWHRINGKWPVEEASQPIICKSTGDGA